MIMIWAAQARYANHAVLILALPAAQAVQCLTDAGMEADLAADLAGRRPLAEGWPDATPGPAASYQPLITMLEGKPGRS